MANHYDVETPMNGACRYSLPIWKTRGIWGRGMPDTPGQSNQAKQQNQDAVGFVPEHYQLGLRTRKIGSHPRKQNVGYE
jgi:hypothetical protein